MFQKVLVNHNVEENLNTEIKQIEMNKVQGIT